MMKNLSLKQQLLFSILSFLIIGMTILFYFSYTDLKKSVDNSQKILYSQEIDNIISLIEQKYEKLQKTGMSKAYEEIFKKGTIDTIKSAFLKYDKDIYPYIINKNKLFLLHPKFNKKNSALYKDNLKFLKIVQLKNGNLNFLYDDKERWTIFKYYEPWDWVIGYSISKNTKYKQLNKFRDDFIISSFIVLFMISLSVIIILKKVLNPIINLTNISKEITSGNLNAKIQIEGTQELRSLSKNFEIMRNKILDDLKTKEKSYELIKEKEEFLIFLINNMPNQIFWKDNKLKYLGCNKNFAKTVGFNEPKEIIGLNDYELNRESKNADFYVQLDKKIIQENKAILELEETFIKSDGSKGWVLTSKIPIKKDSKVMGILGICVDITKIKEQEIKIKNFNEKLQKEVEQRAQELLEQKNIFKTLFNDTADGLSILKVNINKLVDCNKALLKILGYKRKEDFLNLSPYDLSPEFQPDGQKSNEKGKKLIQECLEKGSIKFEWVHTKANKELFWAEILLTKIILNHEVVIYAVWRNIQDKKELEMQIVNKNKDLQESNHELETMIENLRKTQNKLIESEKLAGLGSLVAGVAHEINTPVGVGLTGSSHLDYLSEEIENKYKNEQMSKEDFEDYLKSSKDLSKVIHSNLERTAEIVKNFKQVAVDQTSEQKRVFHVKEYIKGVLISIDSITKQKDIEFKIECDDDLEITSYPGFFAQIITNLVTNSVVHGFKTKEEGKISFTIEKGKNLTLEYSDNGKGISEDKLSKIYEPFFTTNRAQGGSGLGLNIVYNLVTINLKGSIDCKSEIDKGTSFIIKIPI